MGAQELIGKCSCTNLSNYRVFHSENTLSQSPTIVAICQRTPKTTRYNPPVDSQIQFFTSSLNRSILGCFLCHHVHSCYNFKLRFVIELCNSATKVAKNLVPAKCFWKKFEDSKNLVS